MTDAWHVLEWQSGLEDQKVEGYPPDGTWCWVKDKRPNVTWIAKRTHHSAGGWGNDDTWEDFRREIIAWIPIDVPEGYEV